MEHKNIKVLSVIIVLMLGISFYSCQDDDDDMFVLSNAVLELGISKDDVKNHFSEDIITEEADVIYAYNGQDNIISYQFTDNVLSEIAYVIPQSNVSQKQINDLIRGAECLGLLGVGKEIYVNEDKNQIIEIRTAVINAVDYYIFGVTTYN